MDKVDFKKLYKDLYVPKKEPAVIDVPEMIFFAVDGKGNPNDPEGEYQKAVSLLYALTFTVKMSKMGPDKIKGYYEYVVPPLEGLWDCTTDGAFDYSMLKNKDNFRWRAMIRQPEFVTQDVFNWAVNEVENKKGIDSQKARYFVFREGLCAQCMHIGPYDDEPATSEKINSYIKQNGLVHDYSDARRHHEIYLGDPRKTSPANLKTVLRTPVKYK